MMIKTLIASAALALAATSALAQDKPVAVDRAAFDKLLADGFAKAPEEWRARMALDETQRACTETRNHPSNAQAAAII